MQPLYKKLLTPLLIIAVYPALHGQMIIKGPVCVKAGGEYQYNIEGPWKENGNPRVCVTGGVISETQQTCLSAETIASVRVIWNDKVVKGSISLTSSSGTATIDVGITEELSPGTIGAAKRQQISYNTKPAAINCTPASGGNCIPSYQYQWQWSEDSFTWQDVAGANSQNLSVNSLLKQAAYYRRKVTENKSGDVAYSEIMSVLVTPQDGSN